MGYWKDILKTKDETPSTILEMREEFFNENRNHYYWLFDECENIKLNACGEIPFDVLVERASAIRWGSGGAYDRSCADEVTDKHLTDFERSIMIAFSTRNLGEGYRYIFHLIKDRLED